jgi:hypothetical protein
MEQVLRAANGGEGRQRQAAPRAGERVVKRERNLGRLVARARRSKAELPLHWEDQTTLATFDCIKDAYESGIPLEESDLEFLIALGDACTLPAREGRPPGWSKWTERDPEWGLLCAKHLFEFSMQAYRQAKGRQRIRLPEKVRPRDNIPDKLRQRAIQLVREKCPQFEIDPVELRNFIPRPNAVVIAYVDEHMPEAKAKMQDYARALAGSRGRAQRSEGAALSR